MTTSEPHGAVGPLVRPASPPGPGTDGTGRGPVTDTFGPSVTPASPSTSVPLGPSADGTGQGTGAGPSAQSHGTERGTTGPARDRSHRAAGTAGPRSRGTRAAGPRTAGRKIAGSRLIPGTNVQIPRGKIGAVLSAISVALVVVIGAPTLLSSQDLYRWASDPRGLGLPAEWAVFVPIALDLAAIVCIGMTLVAAWRRERATVFSLLVWVFAGVSAYAQYNHGEALRVAGKAQDAWWAMPAFALLGPLLLEITLQTLRKWAKKDAEESVPALRWLVSPWRSFGAWKYALREGLTPAEAWVFKRDLKLLKGMQDNPVDAVIHAANAIQSLDQYVIRQWLAARGTYVTQRDLDEGVDLVPTDLWDTEDVGDPDGTGTAGPGPVLAIPSHGPALGPAASPLALPAGPGTGSLSPAGPAGNAGPFTGTGAGTAAKTTAGTRSRGTGGTDGTGGLAGPGTILSLVDGTDLTRLYEMHRERLITVKNNFKHWSTVPEADLKTDAIKAAGGFAKQQYACDLRKILLHERAQLAQTSN